MNTKMWLRAFAVLLSLSLIWGVSEYKESHDLKIVTENHYRRSLADFVSSLDGLESNLAKSRAAGTATQQVYYFSQAWHQSEMALKNLTMLPAEKFGFEYIDQFLNQIGEFSGILTQQVAKGNKITSEQDQTLNEMHKRLTGVNRDVQDFYNDLNTANIAWLDKQAGQAEWTYRGIPNRAVAPVAAEGDEQGNEEQHPKPLSVRGGLEQLDASLQKLPPFTYSGQTDTHYAPEPLGLPDKSVTEEGAKAVAKNFLAKIGYAEAQPELSGTSTGPLGGYTFQYEDKTVDVSKKGGVVTLFRDERPLDVQQLSVEKTAAKALQTLKELGWNNLVQTSVEDFGGYILLEAVAQVDKVRIYPDKIRLTVGRDNGQILAYDSTPYWAFHHDRDLTNKIALAEARQKLRSDMQIKENRLAVISLPGWQEAFCYEFRVKKDDEEFLVYINAQNGVEEKIQRIIMSPRGEYLQ